MEKYDDIHKYLFLKSKKYKFLNSIINTNGVLTLCKPNKDFFSCIFHTIVSQQISNKAAVRIWEKVEYLLKKQKTDIRTYSKNKYYFEILNKIGISKKKLDYFYLMVKEMDILDKDEIYYKNLTSENFRKEFKKFKGIGDWSCDMVEIFYFNRLNVWPSMDLVIHKFSTEMHAKYSFKSNYYEDFKPYKTILALHLWKFLD